MKHTALQIGILISGFILLGGCANDRQPISPVQPQENAGVQLLIFPQHAGHGAVLLGSPDLTETKSVKASCGGEISVGLITVKFPSNAVRRDTIVTVTLLDQEQIRFRIEPADLVLLQPAQIEIARVNRTDHLPGHSPCVVRMVADIPEVLPSQSRGDKARAIVATLGDFAFADLDREGNIQFIRYLSGPGYETRLIEAARGGQVRYDRYKVTIPRGALSEDTYITVRDPGLGYLMCELEPHMVFLAPVELELDLTGLGYQPYTDWTIFWFDPDTEQWENQGGAFQNEKLTVELGHFSQYAAGRAGW